VYVDILIVLTHKFKRSQASIMCHITLTGMRVFHFLVDFCFFPELKITLLGMGSGSNWWFEENFSCRRRFIPTQVTLDGPKMHKIPFSKPPLTLMPDIR